ncbi:hypothetical protein RRG08_011614 [Elysia crispata]|uniref:Uncharacterized protein n=1 Tax=Elysia crispata TaxID=231223 RepID=A0AAE1CJV9_9GAST|nr:hypothetical protein RRG08_011614 [Elysia crispata]
MPTVCEQIDPVPTGNIYSSSTHTSLHSGRATWTSSHHSNEPFSLQIYTDFLTPLQRVFSQQIYTDFLTPLQRAFLITDLHGLPHTTPTSLSLNRSTRTSSHHFNELFS